MNLVMRSSGPPRAPGDDDGREGRSGVFPRCSAAQRTSTRCRDRPALRAEPVGVRQIRARPPSRSRRVGRGETGVAVPAAEAVEPERRSVGFGQDRSKPERLRDANLEGARRRAAASKSPG